MSLCRLSWSARQLLLAGIGSVVAIALARPQLGHQPFAGGLFFIVFAGQSCGFVLALRAEAGLADRERAPALAVIVLLGLFMRGLLMPLPVFLTTDLARYRFDGQLVEDGQNPYAATPAALVRANPRTVASRPAHAEVHAIYPPLAQAVFAVATRAGGSERVFKTLAVAGDLGVLGAWLLLAPLAGWRGTRCVVWAWHPMVQWAFAGSGHVDALAIAPLLLALRALLAGSTLVAATVLGCAAAAKLAPLALVAVWWRELARRATLAPLVLLAFYAPYLAAGSGLTAGVATYLLHWEHMGLVFEPLAHITRPGFARSACLLGLAATVLHGARSDSDPLTRTRNTIGWALLLTPTLHPWYVCWIVPLCEPRSGFPFLVLSLSAVWSYGPLLGRPDWGTWGHSGWYWFLAWTPALLAACLQRRGLHCTAAAAGRGRSPTERTLRRLSRGT